MSSKTSSQPLKSGLLLIDKPQGFTSHDVIAVCRRVLQTKKIGHSGTLDPMATGLLILLIGRQATKKQTDFLRLSKRYSATLALGQETDSWDADGQITVEKPVPPLSQTQVEQAVQTLSGTVEQPIPFFSAKRVQGKHLYDLARQGKPLERTYNQVTVSWPRTVLSTPSTIEFTVDCSCGTYVRSLGYLLAQKLGTVGHLSQLRREKIGPYDVREAFDGNLLKGCGLTLYERVISL